MTSSTTFQPTANVDGCITPLEEARISVLDRGFLYGDSVYEVFRTYAGVPLFFEQHCRRLENSARLIHMQMSQSRQQLTQEIRRTVQATRATSGQEVYVRYHVTRGVGPVDLFPDADLTTSFVILVKEAPTWSREFYTRGLRLAIPPTRRNPVDALNPNVKGGNYLNNVLALAEAKQLGADDCLMLNHDGFVTELSNSNIFFVLDGRLVTPNQACGNLRGITKGAISQACSAAGLKLEEVQLPVEQIPNASECFVTSSTREVMPACSLRLEDGRMLEFPTGGGTITRQVAAYYRHVIEEYVAEHQDLKML